MHVDYQVGGGLCLWVLCGIGQAGEPRTFMVYQNEIEVGPEEGYVGTASHGMLPESWHVFEIVKGTTWGYAA